jgi:hypothetical protein
VAYATTTDVEVSLGRSLTAEEATRASGLLGRIEARITHRIPDLAAQITATPTLRNLVVEVEADAVARVLRNPEGFLQEQDGDYLYIRDRSLSSGYLDLTEQEWTRLGVSSGAFTVRPDYAAALEDGTES